MGFCICILYANVQFRFKKLMFGIFCSKKSYLYILCICKIQGTYKEYFRFRNFVVNFANKAFFGWDSDFDDFLHLLTSGRYFFNLNMAHILTFYSLLIQRSFKDSQFVKQEIFLKIIKNFQKIVFQCNNLKNILVRTKVICMLKLKMCVFI